jgi:hypothetical protein
MVMAGRRPLIVTFVAPSKRTVHELKLQFKVFNLN